MKDEVTELKRDLVKLAEEVKALKAEINDTENERDQAEVELQDAKDGAEELRHDAEAYQGVVELAERYEWREARDGSLLRWLEDRLEEKELLKSELQIARDNIADLERQAGTF